MDSGLASIPFWFVAGLWPLGVVEAFDGPFRDLAFDDSRV